MEIELTCWWCGVEPTDVVELMQFGGTVRLIPHWPAGDHPHAERPPSPGQLQQAGHESLMRIVDAADLRPESERLRVSSEMIR